jgi:hypothetical protein
MLAVRVYGCASYPDLAPLATLTRRFLCFSDCTGSIAAAMLAAGSRAASLFLYAGAVMPFLQRSLSFFDRFFLEGGSIAWPRCSRAGSRAALLFLYAGAVMPFLQRSLSFFDRFFLEGLHRVAAMLAGWLACRFAFSLCWSRDAIFAALFVFLRSLFFWGGSIAWPRCSPPARVPLRFFFVAGGGRCAYLALLRLIGYATVPRRFAAALHTLNLLLLHLPLHFTEPA